MSVCLTRKPFGMRLIIYRSFTFMTWLRRNGIRRQHRALCLLRGDNLVQVLRGLMTSHHTICKNMISYCFHHQSAMWSRYLLWIATDCRFSKIHASWVRGLYEDRLALSDFLRNFDFFAPGYPGFWKERVYYRNLVVVNLHVLKLAEPLHKHTIICGTG